MNVNTFLHHWGIRRNPFADEEAQHDEVFTRLRGDAFEHFEVPKIVGDLRHPASAVVFGEKGSGKTAIRMQIEARVEAHNREHPRERALVVAYDDLNPVLDRLSRRVRGKDAHATLRALTLNDHIDGMLSVAVPALVDRALAPKRRRVVEDGEGPDAHPEPLDRVALRRLDRATRLDWLLLQALYDRPEQSVIRGRALRRRLRERRRSGTRPLRGLAIALWALTAAAGAYAGLFEPPGPQWAATAGLVALIVVTLAATALAIAGWLRVRRLAGRLAKQLRVLDRSPDALRMALERLPREVLDSPLLPVDDLDEARYEMLTRLQRAIRPLGFRSVIVLMDRVDEPTLISGDRALMQAVVWPLLNNKFLQQPGFAVKLLLPLELRYAIQAESPEFFQAARLDKQNMVDRLQWSGATLFDVCNRRIQACMEDAAEPVSLHQLFDETTSREELLAALDQMRQPRDAFKLIYQVIQQHCASVTDDDEAWQIPRHVVEDVLTRQKDRLDALRSGLTPA